MAISKSLILIILVICWLGIGGGYCEAVGGGEPLPCIQKLLPCEAYLIGSPASASLSTPATTCCVPLKQMVVSDTQCLCAVFNNQAILKSLNVTQDEALNLVKTCGANADISICSKAAPSGSPSIPAAPSTNGSGTNAPPKNNAGPTTTTVYSLMSAAILMSFIVSLF